MEQHKNNTDVTQSIKNYLHRLNAGEALDDVRADFVKEFKEVEASAILQAEQELIKDGTPLEEVQRLCDVHAALFRDVVRKPDIQASREHAAALKEQKLAAARALTEIEGHPLHTFTLENEALAKVLEQCKKELEQGSLKKEMLGRLRELSIHYAKKGDLLYPHLKVAYGISGPSDIMWTHDDEIRDELSALAGQEEQDEAWKDRLRALFVRIEEMIYKEENILFPNCTMNFTKEEWYGIYRDSKDYAPCFGVENGVWEEAKGQQTGRGERKDGEEIVLAGGHLTLEQLEAMLNTIPLEITFVDVDNVNRFFNEGPKVFKRPGMAIDREVFSCHPPKIEKQVRSIIAQFREGTSDKVPIWMDKGGRTMLVTYMAVRDKQGKYIGTMELVQDMEFAKEHFKKA